MDTFNHYIYYKAVISNRYLFMADTLITQEPHVTKGTAFGHHMTILI